MKRMKFTAILLAATLTMSAIPRAGAAEMDMPSEPVEEAEPVETEEPSDTEPVELGEPIEVLQEETDVAVISSMFAFTTDPYGLVEETGAARYGGGAVEPGAKVIFHNLTGEYDFSSKSDRLSVRNKSAYPLRVTVTASLSNMGDVQVDDLETPIDQSEPAVYLAIVDSQTREAPVSLNEAAVVAYDLPAASDPKEVSEYSFGLAGTCNLNDDWNWVNLDATVTVTWNVEPIPPEGTDLPEISVDSLYDLIIPTNKLNIPEQEALSEGAQPVENVEPFDITEPVEDAELSDVAEAVEDAEPSDEAQSVEDAEPSDDTQSVGEVELSDDTQPVEDTEPYDDTEPVEDTAASDVAKPVDDAAASDVTETVADEAPSDDTKPVEDMEPPDSVEPMEDAEVSDVAEPVADEEAFDIAEPVENASPVEEDAEPSNFVEPVGNAEPLK